MQSSGRHHKDNSDNGGPGITGSQTKATDDIWREIDDLHASLFQSGDLDKAHWLVENGGYNDLESKLEPQANEHYLDRLKDCWGRACDLLDYDRRASTLQSLLNRYRCAAPINRLAALEIFWKELLLATEFTRERLGEIWLNEQGVVVTLQSTMNQLRRQVHEHHTLLADRLNSAQTLIHFHDFIRQWERQGVKGLNYPSEWEHLVAWFIPAPTIDMFPGRSLHLPEGELLAKTVLILEDQRPENLAEIMLILARCQGSRHNRRELGLALRDKLILIAHRLRPHIRFSE